MHALRILQQRLRSHCPQVHLKRLCALLACVAGALYGQRITLTELGRALPSRAQVKHNIKRVDRLLGNPQLGAERFSVYQATARWLLGPQRRPVMVVDWSDLTTDRRWQLLRAALPVGGRTLTLYEEVHPLARFANPRVHRAFLARLKALLPEGSIPILLTDAGFRAPWFKAVSRLGWQWVGRIRNRDHVQRAASAHWHPCKTLYAQARLRPQSLGPYQIVRSNPVACQLHLVRQPRRHRHHLSLLGKRIHSNQSLKKAAANREPWLLAASPGLAHASASQIVALYRQRMSIEEGFRDLKCERYGLGFALNLSHQPERLAALLLIAMLALLVLWLIGSAASARCAQKHYQSNSQRKRRTLSLIYLALLILRRNAEHFRPRELLTPLRALQLDSPPSFTA